MDSYDKGIYKEIVQAIRYRELIEVEVDTLLQLCTSPDGELKSESYIILPLTPTRTWLSSKSETLIRSIPFHGLPRSLARSFRSHRPAALGCD